MIRKTFINFIKTVKGHPDGSGKCVKVGNRLPAMALSARRWGQKNKSAMRTRPFIGSGTVQ